MTIETRRSLYYDEPLDELSHFLRVGVVLIPKCQAGTVESSGAAYEEVQLNRKHHGEYCAELNVR